MRETQPEDLCIDVDSAFMEWQLEAMFPDTAKYAFAAGFSLGKRLMHALMKRNVPLDSLHEAMDVLKRHPF